ncbi:MAG: hypothetical protein RL001_1904 [Pseudomonadota bacterium]|jgi:hypothetical protein|nr:hypothetical protein [Oxalobacteraceae bacterium]
MPIAHRRSAAVLIILVSLTGCASQSELTAIHLDSNHPQYNSRSCQNSRAASERHKEVKSATLVATPALLLLSGGLLLPVVAANAGLDAADRLDASTMAESCGGQGQSTSDIIKDVAIGASVGVATGGLPNR